VTGDHGEALGDHGEESHGLFAYESTLRVPLIIATLRSGSVDTPGEVSGDPVRHVDILPTVLDALQLPAPAGLPGHSLRRAVDRADGLQRPSYFEAMSPMLDYGWAPLSGIIAGRDKFIDLPLPELYDLGVDPAERTDLSASRRDRQRVLAARLGSFQAELPAGPAPEDPDIAARLQSLGYVSGSAARKQRYTEADDPKRLVDVDQRMHDAVAFDEAGRTREAVELYRQVLERRPDMLAAARHLAFDYWRTSQPALAIDALRAAVKAAPSPAAQIQLGTYLVEAGRVKEALALLEAAVSAEPTLDALNALGIAYGRSGRSREALSVFARSLEIDPDNPMTHENIGAIHLDAGRLTDARREFEHALHANPASAQALAGLAAVAFHSGDRESALANWKRAVALDPTNWDALYNLGVQLLRAGRMADARPYLEQFVRSAPASLYAKDIANISADLARIRD
jgi:tetratricopeptide (TPR) repeat protein